MDLELSVQETTSQGSGVQTLDYPEAMSFPSPLSFDMESTASHALQANTLSDLLWEIYFTVFESRHVTWLGNSCRPFLGTAPVSGVMEF